MSFFISAVIFIIVLFFYIHIVAQYKRSEDLEVYEMDYSKNDKLQEVCDVKQPVLFNYKSVNPVFFEKLTDETISDLATSQDVHVKEIDDYWKAGRTPVEHVILPLSSFMILSSTDTKSRYFTENNRDLIDDTSKIDALFRNNDEFLKPMLTVHTKYDICMGSKGVTTPMRYHTYYRRFLCVNSGKLTVKLTPFKSSKYLHPVKNYENYEFRSPVNVWKPQEEYMNDMDKMKAVEVEVTAGNMLYVPPYWWYSVKYNDTDTLVSEFTYISAMNSIANSWDWMRNATLSGNTERVVENNLYQ